MFDLSSARFAFLDMETTGLSPWFGDRICEVGIVLTEGRRVKQQVHKLVNPEYPLSLGAASTSGLTNELLVNAPLFGEVANDIVEWLKGTVVVCHNAQFDVQFLDSEFRRLRREIQIPNLVDTLLLARQHFDLPSYSLHYLAEAFHIPMTVSHRALPDVHTGRGVFFAIMDSLTQQIWPSDEFKRIYHSDVWHEDAIPTETVLGKVIYGSQPINVRYINLEDIVKAT